jgi:hypothetical protein
VSAGTLLLVHGAGSGPWVFQAWPAHVPWLQVETVDLHAGLDPALASMADYAAARPPRILAGAGGAQAGIAVPRLPCPALVVYGEEFADERGRRLAKRYEARELALPGKSHWDLVLDRDAIAAVAGEIRTLI